MKSDQNDQRPEEDRREGAPDPSINRATENPLKSFLMRGALTGWLAGKEAHRKKLQLVDLRKLDQAIGKKAYESHQVPPEHVGIVSQIDELHTKMDTLRQPDAPSGESFSDKAKAAALAAAKRAKIEALMLKEHSLQAELGTKLRAAPNVDPSLVAEVSTANALQDRIRAVETEIEVLRAGSWVKRPLLLFSVLMLLVLAFFTIRSMRSGRHFSDPSGPDASIAAEMERYQQDQKNAAAEAEKNRQTQLNSVRDLMAMTEKSTRDYQEKQRREQEERDATERAKAELGDKQRADVARQKNEQRDAAEAKQKAQENEFLKHRAPPVVAVPNNAASAAPPKITLKTIPLGPLPKTSSEMESRVALNEDGSRILVVASQGSRVQAIVDGQPGPVCRKIRWTDRDGHSPEGKHFAHPPFSPDSQRVSYITELDGGKEAVVIDSSQSPVYDKVLWLTFGPMGHHVAYQAQEKDRSDTGSPHREGSFSRLIDDGKGGPSFDRIGNVTFSADGHHLAYSGFVQPYKGMQYGHPDFGRGEHAVVLDGQEQGNRHTSVGQLALSRDGRHLAFLIGVNDSLNMRKAVIDGQETPPYAAIERLSMSDDGSRTALVVRASEKSEAVYRMIDNGKEGAEYGFIGDIVISAQGERLAYVAQHKEGNLNEQFVVDNDKPSVPYDHIDDLRVSDDGGLLSFKAKSSQGVLLVVNGKESGPFYQIDGKPVFSSDNKHWACAVAATDSSESRAIIVDGQSHPLPKGARHGAFMLQFRPDQKLIAASQTGDDSVAFEVETTAADSPVPSQVLYSRDGTHVAKVFTSDQGHSYETQQVTLDDAPVGPLYLRVRRLQLSEDGTHIAFVGSYNGSSDRPLAHANVDGKEGPAHDAIDDLVLSADGKHVAYAAEDRTKGARAYWLVVDGFMGPTFDDMITPRYQNVRRAMFQPDGSLTFLAGVKGQLGRYTYPVESFAFMPSMDQAEGAIGGAQVLRKLDDLRPYLVLGPHETLYGVGNRGGKYGHGLLFSCRTDGGNFRVLHDFYGGDDGGYPKNLIMGQGGDLYGFVDAGLFRYQIAGNKYEIVSYGSSPEDLSGVLPDGAFIGAWWVIYPTGGGALSLGEISRYLAAVGPDGAIYSTTDDSLFRQSSIYSEPVLLHRFSDTPEEGKQLAGKVTFDPSGVLFGFTKPSGSGRHSIIYRMNRDGSDFRLLVKQDAQIDIDSLIAGDDGMLYFFKGGDVNRSSLFYSIPANGGKPTILLRTALNPLLCRDHVIYGTSGEAITRLQIPRGELVASQTPQLIINSIDPPALERIEPVTFTNYSGEAVSSPANTKLTWLATPPPLPVMNPTNRSKPATRSAIPAAVQPVAPSANTRLAIPSATGDQSIASAFAEKTVSAMSSGDLDLLVSLYADRVDCLDQGVVGPDAIRNEFRQYFERWPQTSWQLTGPVSVQPMEGLRYKLTFPVAFDARNPATGKHASGNAQETMVIAQDATGAWKIVYQRESISHSKKTQTQSNGKHSKPERYDPSDQQKLPENLEEIARRLQGLVPR